MGGIERLDPDKVEQYGFLAGDTENSYLWSVSQYDCYRGTVMPRRVLALPHQEEARVGRCVWPKHVRVICLIVHAERDVTILLQHNVFPPSAV